MSTHEWNSDGWLQPWEAAPRDGPAVFIAEVTTLGGTAINGGWLDLTAEPEQLHQDIVAAVGAQAVASANWQIVDQIGLGDTMLPEDLNAEELRQLAIRQAAIRRHPSSRAHQPRLSVVPGGVEKRDER